MDPLDFTGGSVYAENSRLYTLSSNPGIRIYGERIVKTSDGEYREWDPQRSKFAAYIKTGGRVFPFRKDSKVLYLGASSGTTASHISDICADGRIYCVEFSPRMFRDLTNACAVKPNMIPILGNAFSPEDYQFAVDAADIVYSDVAQKNQAEIIVNNMNAFRADIGVLAVKARSEDVTSDPSVIYKAAERYLKEKGFKILDSRDLMPYENAHEMILFERK